MSDMLELLRKRRSIRKFSREKIAPGTVQLLVEALLRAPSSRGINPWEFVLVDDEELLAKLSRAKTHGAEFLANAPLAVVVCADAARSDVWIEDCAIAAIIVQLAALSVGLGSCWAQMRNRDHDSSRTAEEYVRELLCLPQDLKVEAIIGIGHPGENPAPLPGWKLQHDKVKRNRYLADIPGR
jgi:nitroreductase